MGSEDFYPEERPVHEVSVDGFWIDRCTTSTMKTTRIENVMFTALVGVRDVSTVTGAIRPIA
jgi:hypothetical protein